MRKTLAKIRHYINTYICQTRWVKNMVVPVVIALIVATYLDVQCSALSSKMTTKAREEDDAGKLVLLKIFALYFFIEYTLKYLVSIFDVQFVAVSMRAGFKNFFQEYLAIKYESFHRIGVGEAQYNIVRRSTALADFLTSFTMFFMANAFFFAVAIHTGIASIPWNTKLLIVAAITGFLVLSTGIQYLRAKVRRRVNQGFQANSRKLYDILFNYERIVTYDNMDVEGAKYWDSMGEQVFYSVIYWVTYELADALNSAAFILLNVYLIAQFNRTEAITRENFQDFTVLFAKLGEKVFEISRNIDEIFTLFTNLDQSLIADCPVENDEGLLQLCSFRKEIRIEGLAFRHGGSLVFEDVSTVIKRGEMVAIAGPNGTGKSTFAKILLGLYDYSGTVEIDGHEYGTVSKKAIRDLVNYIPQNPCLFDGTIMRNLTVAHNDIEHEKLVAYAKLYNTHEMLSELGYDKAVGERGKNLSGGQAQKVSFMRAVVKNSEIFVLDEATSNMDAASELEIIMALREHAVSKTVVMIIHNLSLLKHFDRVLFFLNRTLSEQGSFEEIYKAKGEFSKFYDEAIS